MSAASETRLAEFLPFHRPYIGPEEIAEVVDTLQSGWLTLGPKTARFEEKFAAAIGIEHAVAVSSCTAALHLVLESLGVGPGDEVITSPYTFTATAAAILYCGATPVLVDTEPEYPNIDPEQVEKKITAKTRVILPVHIGGAPCDMDRLAEIAEGCDAQLVSDAAHALPTSYKGRRLGCLGTAACYSLYAGKNITTGEGGVIATASAGLADELRVRRLHGISRDAWKRYTAEGSWYYEVGVRGFKYNMTDINAAIGLHQLDRLAGFHERRRHLVALYEALLGGIPGVRCPRPPQYGESSWHLYFVHIDEEAVAVTRNQVIEMLKADNIGTSVHFIPLHLHPYYQARLGVCEGDFPNASRLYDNAISLPLFPSMTDDDVRGVARSVARIMRENLR